MNRASVRTALAVALFAFSLIAPIASAAREAPLDAGRTIVAPEAAPNPPDVSVRASGGSVVLEWYHPDTSLTRYEVWRSETPYFDPGAPEAKNVGGYAFSAGIYGEYTEFSFADNGSCGYFVAAGQQLACAPQSPAVKVTGDVGHQYYWILRGSNGEYADSNRVGEFDFALVKGS